jgi:hypothetical protein
MRPSCDLRHAEAFGVVHFLEQDAGAALLAPESVHRPGNRLLDDVVAQHHAELLAVGEVMRQVQRL